MFRPLALPAVLLLAGCSLTQTGAKPDLALACQTRECKCLEAKSGLFSKRKEADILWRQNGDAYCPEGYELTLIAPPPPK